MGVGIFNRAGSAPGHSSPPHPSRAIHVGLCTQWPCAPPVAATDDDNDVDDDGDGDDHDHVYAE